MPLIFKLYEHKNMSLCVTELSYEEQTEHVIFRWTCFCASLSVIIFRLTDLSHCKLSGLLVCKQKLWLALSCVCWPLLSSPGGSADFISPVFTSHMDHKLLTTSVIDINIITPCVCAWANPFPHFVCVTVSLIITTRASLCVNPFHRLCMCYSAIWIEGPVANLAQSTSHVPHVTWAVVEFKTRGQEVKCERSSEAISLPVFMRVGERHWGPDLVWCFHIIFY